MIENLSYHQKAALLGGKNSLQTRGLSIYGVPSLLMSDGPNGVRKQSGSADHLGLADSIPATCFPTAVAVANSWDVDLAERLGEALGREAAALGVDVLLAPAMNLKRSPLGGRSFEYFSEDPYLTGKLAARVVAGIQAVGVAAVPKHFAANSQETNRMTTDSIVDERSLRELYLTAFEIVVRESRPRAIMSSYNRVNGTYAHENAFLLKQVLRDEWGFQGVVISDWGGGNDAVEAVRNGGTLEMPSPGFESARNIVDAIERGDLAESDLDERAAEVVELALAARTPLDPPIEVDWEAHHALARKVARDGIVLLKNEDALLPLDAGTQVALIGDFAIRPRYQGAGSAQVNPIRLVSAIEAAAHSTLEVVASVPGFARFDEPDDDLARDAVAAATACEVVLLYLGLDELSETEGEDRQHLRLNSNQIDVLERVRAVNSKVVVVLSAGGVVEMPWIDLCPAVVHGALGGQAGAEAMVDVITGIHCPGGKLAESYPLVLDDNPTASRFPAPGERVEYREGPFVGYRFYDSTQTPVRFPFGFGLSYTRFEYSNLEATRDAVTFVIRNVGLVAGTEIAQLYLGFSGASSLPRPTKELKGFAKVHLDPGQSTTVSIGFDDLSFRVFDTASGSWRVESGRYTVHIGASVADIRLVADLEVVGDKPDSERDPALEVYFRVAVAGVTDADFAALLGAEIVTVSRTTQELSRNDSLLHLRYARNPLGRAVYRFLDRQRRASAAARRADLNLVFLSSMPFRAIAVKMTNGALSMPMVDAILTFANGRPFAGIGAFIRGAGRNRRDRALFTRELERRP